MNRKYKEDFIRAGAIAREVRAYGKSLIKKGASYNNVIAAILSKIAELGAIPAFPPQIALDHVAAHFLPKPGQDIIFSEEVVKLDIGVCCNGAIGDCAATIDLSGKYQALVDAAEAALLAAEKIVKVGLPIRQIGKVVDETISSYGYKPIKNLSGHGLGHYKIHMYPKIPNYDDHSSGVIKKEMTLAIEPFATDGAGFIYDAGDPAIFSFVKSRPVDSDPARRVLDHIKTLHGLPFSLHDIVAAGFSTEEAAKALDILMEAGAAAGYAPLIEQKHGMVAQAENSILIDRDGSVLVTTR